MKSDRRIKTVIFGPWGSIYWSPQDVPPPPTIESLLSRANRNRRVRTLDADDIARIVRECRDAEEGHWSHVHGGRVAGSYGWRARSTFALAAKIEGDVYVGITTIDATGQGTPVSGWRELAYLSASGDRKQAVKLRSWRDGNLGRSVVLVRPD